MSGVENGPEAEDEKGEGEKGRAYEGTARYTPSVRRCCLAEEREWVHAVVTCLGVVSSGLDMIRDTSNLRYLGEAKNVCARGAQTQI
jgi:hypothetical protein